MTAGRVGFFERPLALVQNGMFLYDVAFVLVYDRILSVAENTQNFDYLRSRLGI